jgi:hypothetical protein
MRKIEFRVWYRPTSQFINHCSVGNGVVQHDKEHFAMLEDDDCVVQQFTGLKDVNGVDTWLDDECRYLNMWRAKSGDYSERDNEEIVHKNVDYEVIGNIMENEA